MTKKVRASNILEGALWELLKVCQDWDGLDVHESRILVMQIGTIVNAMDYLLKQEEVSW